MFITINILILLQVMLIFHALLINYNILLAIINIYNVFYIINYIFNKILKKS
jgi:hypothetical protein